MGRLCNENKRRHFIFLSMRGYFLYKFTAIQVTMQNLFSNEGKLLFKMCSRFGAYN